MTDNEQPKVPRIFADADLFLDLVRVREAFKESFLKFDEMIKSTQSKEIQLYVTDKCLTRMRSENIENGDEWVKKLNEWVIELVGEEHIITITAEFKESAKNSSIPDFDSAVEVMCAKQWECDQIVTLTPHNFDGADLEIISLLALTETDPKTENKLPKHLIKVKVCSLVLFSMFIFFSMFIYKKYTEKDIKIVKLSLEEIDKDLCHDPSYYNPRFRQERQGWEYKDNSNFSDIKLRTNNSLKEVIPAYRLRCGYIFKTESPSAAGSSPDDDDIGLDLKPYCREKFVERYGYEYETGDRINAAPLHYDKIKSIACILTN